MTITKTRLGTNPDGSPQYHYYSEIGLVVTGPITGVVTLPDGTKYDVSPEVIEAPPAHHGAISHAIGVRHELEGHPKHTDGTPFKHQCTGDCTLPTKAKE